MNKALQGPSYKSIMLTRCHLLACIVLLLSSHTMSAYGKSFEHHQTHHERIVRKRNAGPESPSCELVQHFFDSLNVSVNHPQPNDKPNGE